MAAERARGIVLAHGARAAERALLEELALLSERARAAPELLARPVRVIVPSRALRVHVAERLAAELGSVLGIAVQTLAGAAAEILERTGETAPGGDLHVELFARRFAREEPALFADFAAFDDGFRTVAGSVRDLLDAGFEPAHEELVRDCLAELALSRPERERALALARAALRTLRAIRERGLGARCEVLRRASEALARDPGRALPARRVFVHGFADATGRAADLIEALARRAGDEGALVLVDQPLDPDSAGAPGAPSAARVDVGSAWTARLLERLSGSLGLPAQPAAPGELPAPLALFRAPGETAEAREVARRVRAAIAAGARPERIGIVARDLGPYRSALRAQLGALGVPFSGAAARAPLDGAGRRILALCCLLEERERAPADRWLDALLRVRAPQKGWRRPAFALRLALCVLGAARLGEVAELSGEVLDLRLPSGALKLPVRTRLAPGEPEKQRGPSLERLRVGREELDRAVRAAAALARRLARWPERASAERHAAELALLCRRELGWRSAAECARLGLGDGAELRVAQALERLVEEAAGEELDYAEFALAARRALFAASEPALGGQGGGVQILSAMEARARTFEHLFVLGMNRGAFPRVGREDALLGDDLRRALAAVLPDVPIRARARDEDRYLFAQLASASPRPTFSWRTCDDAGKPQVISPLVERLLREQEESAVASAPPLFASDPERIAAAGPHTAREHAVLAGLHGDGAGAAEHAERLALALCEAEFLASPEDARRVARARAAVLEAYEKGPFEPDALAPYLGFLGEQLESDARPDPRQVPLFVTRFENLARCPWKGVLEKSLGLEEAPDPLDALPKWEPMVLGSAVHAVLEEIAREALGASAEGEAELGAVLARAPVPVAWLAAARDPVELDLRIARAVRTELLERRTPQAGLVRTYVERARPLVVRGLEFLAHEQALWPGSGVLGVEVGGSARLARDAGEVELHFRADLVQALGAEPDATVVASDFKTGKVAEGDGARGEGLAARDRAAGTDLRARHRRARARGARPLSLSRGRPPERAPIRRPPEARSRASTCSRSGPIGRSTCRPTARRSSASSTCGSLASSSRASRSPATARSPRPAHGARSRAPACAATAARRARSSRSPSASRAPPSAARGAWPRPVPRRAKPGPRKTEGARA